MRYILSALALAAGLLFIRPDPGRIDTLIRAYRTQLAAPIAQPTGYPGPADPTATPQAYPPPPTPVPLSTIPSTAIFEPIDVTRELPATPEPALPTPTETPWRMHHW